MSNVTPSGVCHLVIGGNGFLGSAIVRALVKRGEANVHNVDIRQTVGDQGVEKAAFHSADITSLDSLNSVFAQVKPAVVYHTASPLAQTAAREALEAVNVKGTANIVRACQQNEVKALVYTSSASVVFTGKAGLINVDERMPCADPPFDLYSETKARGENLVLQANTDDDASGLKTVALRPAGIFGPHDRQAIPGFMMALKTGKKNIQLGDNTNLFDFTHVDNVAHAHLLAADRLVNDAKPYPRDLLGSVHLSTRSNGTGDKDSFLDREVPTSEARPDVAGAPDYARKITDQAKALVPKPADGEVPSTDLRPVVRNKYDQFFHIVNPEIASAANPMPETSNIAETGLGVAGEAFFITNGQPMPFWDFPRSLWRAYDPVNGAVDLKDVWTISSSFAFPLAAAAETFGKLSGRKSQFDRFRVTFCTLARYHNIEKARRALGYEPVIGMEEAIRQSALAFKEEERRGAGDVKSG